MSLRVRLLLIVATTFAIVVVGCVYAAHVSAQRELRSETDHFLSDRSRDARIQNGLRETSPERGPDPDADPGPGALVEPDAVTQFLKTNGSVARYVRGLPRLPVDARDLRIAARGSGTYYRDVTVDKVPYRMLTVGLDGGGAAQIARSVKDTNDVLSTLDVRLLLIALGGTVAAAALAWLIARRIVRPVEQLTSAAESVAATQDLEHNIDVDRNDEIGRLADSFNTMLVALGASREQQRRLVMDASHELRTPLTALRTNIELLGRASSMADAERAELIAAARIELDELSELVAELVDLATDARAEEPLQEVDLGELARTVVERQRRRTGRQITIELTDAANVTARASALERAVGNLVDNACKFSPPDAPVAVRVHGTTIEVADLGPGIPAAEREHVFDRFYRARQARTKPGSGLGLSIVKQIVEMHGGSVRLDARNGQGTIARIDLPEVPAEG